MKTYQIPKHTSRLPDCISCEGFAARTTYPTAMGGAVLQGKFLLSIGESAPASANLEEQESASIIAKGVADIYDRHKKVNKSLRTFRYQPPSGDSKSPGIAEQVNQSVMESVPGPDAAPTSAAAATAASEPTVQLPGLRGMAQNEELEIIAHGEFEQEADGTPRPVTHYGGLSPAELADYLIAQGLPAGYRGNIRLTGCAAGFGGAKSYANALAYALRNHSSRWEGNPSVLGFIGSTHLEQGKLDSQKELYVEHPTAIKYGLRKALEILDRKTAVADSVEGILIQKVNEAGQATSNDYANIATAANLFDSLVALSTAVDELSFPFRYLEDYEDPAEQTASGAGYDEKAPSLSSDQLYPLKDGGDALLRNCADVLQKAIHLADVVFGAATVPDFAGDAKIGDLLPDLIASMHTTGIKLPANALRKLEVVKPVPAQPALAQPAANAANTDLDLPEIQPQHQHENAKNQAPAKCCVIL